MKGIWVCNLLVYNVNGQATIDENLRVTSNPDVGPLGLGFEFEEVLSFIDNDPDPLALVIAGAFTDSTDPALPERVLVDPLSESLSLSLSLSTVILFPFPFPNPKLSTLSAPGLALAALSDKPLTEMGEK